MVGDTDSLDRVELAEVSHQFGDTAVLEDISLSVTPGEVLGIIGPSGTGKTTLLRILGLFHQPTAGTVRADGTDVWSCSEQERLAIRKRVGMCFQSANLFTGTVRRNVSYGLHIRQSWWNRVTAWIGQQVGHPDTPTIEDALDVVGMADAIDRQVADLSGGEAQRVAFARALAYDPDVLLLDEPTSDLDPRNTAVLEQAIETARDRGVGVAVATHDMHQAERIADSVGVLIGGQIIEVGPTDRIFSDPAEERTRKFIDGELVY